MKKKIKLNNQLLTNIKKKAILYMHQQDYGMMELFYHLIQDKFLVLVS